MPDLCRDPDLPPAASDRRASQHAGTVSLLYPAGVQSLLVATRTQFGSVERVSRAKVQ